MKKVLILVAILALSPVGANAADPQREADVANRGAEVMPFDLQATQHVFSSTRSGGKQKVIARDGRDGKQILLIRQHLRDIASEFRRGDFAGPERIHGQDMPGLQMLKSAKPGDLVIAFKEVPAGAELTFRASKPELVQALHAWFDAQRTDHGHDAMGGHQHPGPPAPSQAEFGGFRPNAVGRERQLFEYQRTHANMFQRVERIDNWRSRDDYAVRRYQWRCCIEEMAG